MDKALLIAWLQSRVDAMRTPVGRAIYAGMISRVQSGQFDKENN